MPYTEDLKILGATEEELFEQDKEDGSDATFNTKGGGNTIGGTNAKPMKAGDTEQITQEAGKTVTTTEA